MTGVNTKDLIPPLLLIRGGHKERSIANQRNHLNHWRKLWKENQNKNIEVGGGGFTVYCLTEGKTLYTSEGKNLLIQARVAEITARGHTEDLGHTVYIFEAGILKFPFDD